MRIAPNDLDAWTEQARKWAAHDGRPWYVFGTYNGFRIDASRPFQRHIEVSPDGTAREASYQPSLDGSHCELVYREEETA